MLFRSITPRTLAVTVEGAVVDSEEGAAVETVLALDHDLVWTALAELGAGIDAHARRTHGAEGD